MATTVHSAASEPIASTLARWVARTTAAPLAAPLAEAARWRILDHVGSALWGVHAGTSRHAYEVAAALAPAGNASLIGRAAQVPPYWAAYVNSSAAPALLDTCRFSESHPGIVVVPAALAVAESLGANGTALAKAVVIGYELMVRLARAAPLVQRGWDPTNIVGAVAVAAACASLYGLTEEQTADAIGIAALAGGGLLEAYAAIESGRHQFGRTSQAGVWAVLLAQRGVRGPTRILEGGALQGTRGFLEAYGDAPADRAALLRALGDEWAIGQVGAKVHDGCRYTNATTDLVLELVQRHRFAVAQVRAVRIGTFDAALDVSVRDPQTVSGALFCLEFVAATALLEGDAFADRFTPARVADAEVRALMRKVTVAPDADAQARYPQQWCTRLEIDLDDGRTLAAASPFPRGEPELPLTADESSAKFMRMATPLLGASGAATALEIGRSVVELSDLRELTAACRTPLET